MKILVRWFLLAAALLLVAHFYSGVTVASFGAALGAAFVLGLLNTLVRPLLVLLIALWPGIGSYLGNFFLARVSMGVVHDLRVALFNSLLTLPDRYFDMHNSGHLISRINFNVTMVTGAATDGRMSTANFARYFFSIPALPRLI